MTCATLKELHAFAWLLGKDEQKQLAAWAKQVLGPSDDGKAAASSSAAGSKAPKTSKASVAAMVKGLWK